MSDQGTLDHVLNRLHQGTYRCEIGNIPINFQTPGNEFAKETVNGLITSFISPGLNIKYATDANYGGAFVHISVQETNMFNEKILSITMLADDRFNNYQVLHNYMLTVQQGGFAYPDLRENAPAIGRDGFYRNRLMYIPQISIFGADGSYQLSHTLNFKRCFPIAMSDIIHSFGDAEPVSFNISFIFSAREIIPSTPPSNLVIPPLAVSN